MSQEWQNGSNMTIHIIWWKRSLILYGIALFCSIKGFEPFFPWLQMQIEFRCSWIDRIYSTWSMAGVWSMASNWNPGMNKRSNCSRWRSCLKNKWSNVSYWRSTLGVQTGPTADEGGALASAACEACNACEYPSMQPKLQDEAPSLSCLSLSPSIP